MASIAKFDTWQRGDGTPNNVPIQVVRTVLGDSLGTTTNDSTQDYPAWAFSSTATTWTDTSNLQLTMTPKFASSLIRLELHLYLGSGAAVKAAGVRILRGTTILWRPMNNATGPFSFGFSGAGELHSHYTVITYDSPNTTSPITYRLQYRTYNGGTASHFFGYAASGHYAPINILTAMEIAQ